MHLQNFYFLNHRLLLLFLTLKIFFILFKRKKEQQTFAILVLANSQNPEMNRIIMFRGVVAVSRRLVYGTLNVGLHQKEAKRRNVTTAMWKHGNLTPPLSDVYGD